MKPDKAIRKTWWSVNWVSFASNGGGDDFCVDADPAEGGIKGK